MVQLLFGECMVMAIRGYWFDPQTGCYLCAESADYELGWVRDLTPALAAGMGFRKGWIDEAKDILKRANHGLTHKVKLVNLR